MRVAIVHDYLTQRGGAERVVLSLLRAFPGARLVTSFYAPDATFAEFRDHHVETLPLNQVAALRTDPRRALPLLAPAFSRLVLDDVDVVVASSSGWAHGVQTDAAKLVYCHNPARWLYQDAEYLPRLSGAVRPLYGVASAPLRSWDRRAAASADLYLANSTVVAARVAKVYGRTAEILHPPPGLRPDGPQEPVPGLEPGFLLTVARPRGYKNTELVCAAVEGMPDARLVVVGGLPRSERGWSSRLRGLTGISDAQLRWLYASCSGLVAVGYEDFGLSPVEAYSLGRPAAVLAAGGYLDSADARTSTVLIETPRVDAVQAGIRTLLGRTWNSDSIRAHADEFSESRFVERLHEHVQRTVQRRSLTAVRGRTTRVPRVLYVDEGARSGGTGLARLLQSVGPRVDAHVVLGQDSPLVPELQATGASVEVLGHGPRSRTAFVWALSRRLRELRPDVVHTTSPRAHVYGGLAARLSGVPVLWHVRGRAASDGHPPAAGRLLGASVRVLPHGVLSPSRAALRAVLRPGASTPGWVVPDAYDPPRALRALREPDGVLRVGTMGRLGAAGGGQDVFLKALAQLDPDLPVVGVVAGNAVAGDRRGERDLRQLADRLGLQGRVQVLTTDDPGEVLAGLDVLVHCAALPDPSPQLVLDAMAAGLAVVACTGAGLDEVVEPGVDGLLVPPGRPELLAEALAKLVADDSLRASLGRAAERAARRYAPDTVVAQLLEVYEQLRRDTGSPASALPDRGAAALRRHPAA